jgi:hypothetical protein
MMAALHAANCTAFGVPFRLSAPSTRLLAMMQRCAPLGVESACVGQNEVREFSLEPGAEESTYRLRICDRTLAEDSDPKALLDCLTSELMAYVAEYAADRVFVHAGAVVWNGQALIFPGTSCAGKTTLVAELVRNGAIYYSDEYAVLDEQGKVHPYARDLQMRVPGDHQQRPVSVAQLNGCAGREALPISHVVFTDYVAGALWKPKPMSGGLAALEMMRHAIPVQRTPARVMTTLAKVMETATAWKSKRGEAGETAKRLLAANIGRGPAA